MTYQEMAAIAMRHKTLMACAMLKACVAAGVNLTACKINEHRYEGLMECFQNRGARWEVL